MILSAVVVGIVWTIYINSSERKGRNIMDCLGLSFVIYWLILATVIAMNIDSITNVITSQDLQKRIEKLEEKSKYANPLAEDYVETKNQLVELKFRQAELSRDKFLIYFGH